MRTLLIEESPLQALPSLMKAVGVTDAIVLQQMHYWLTQEWTFEVGVAERDDKHRPWLVMTYEQMRERSFSFICRRTLENVVARLSDKGLLDVRRIATRDENLNRIAINYGVLDIIKDAMPEPERSRKIDVTPHAKVASPPHAKVASPPHAKVASPLKNKNKSKSKNKILREREDLKKEETLTFEDDEQIPVKILQWYQATGLLPPTDQHQFILRLTSDVESFDVDILEEVFFDWRGHGYRRDNVKGICDWYLAKLRGESYTTSTVSGGSNASGKTAGEELVAAAMEIYNELYK